MKQRIKSLKQAFLALGLALPAFCGAVQAQTTLFFDDFTTWNANSQWSLYDTTHFLQGTQFGNTPTIGTEGTTKFARFTLDSYNPDPAYSGKLFRGTEAQGPTYTVGSGIQFAARLRGKNLDPGIVFAFFTYNSRGVWPNTYLKDEIDFEFLTNLNANEMWLNVWDDWNPVTYGSQQSSQSVAAGLDKSNWNTYKIIWTETAIKWYVNGVLIRTSTNIVPTDPMQLRFNIWAADDRWTRAYSRPLMESATTDPSQNKTYSMDVDWVQVTRLPAANPTPTPTPTPAQPPGAVVGNGTGLSATYYDNKDLTGTTLNRVDPTIDFLWGYGSPASSIGINTFSARWTGLVQAQFSETYTFTTNTDDGVRLWVNGQKLIDKWINQSPEDYSAQITLVAGQKYDIKLEYYDDLDGAVAQLFWSSARTSKRIVPKSQLYSSNDVTPPTATIVTPANNAILPSLTSISGTASDSGSGVGAVYARLRRLSDSYYWNGTTWAAPAALVRVTGTTNWNWTPPTLPNGSYTIQIRADDVARNIFTTPRRPFSINNAAILAGVSSGVQLSSAQASGSEITLFFTGALGEAARDVATWQVNSNGQAVDVSRVALSNGAVVLSLAAQLESGSEISVAWPQLRDAQGNAVSGDWQGVAR